LLSITISIQQYDGLLFSFFGIDAGRRVVTDWFLLIGTLLLKIINLDVEWLIYSLFQTVILSVITWGLILVALWGWIHSICSTLMSYVLIISVSWFCSTFIYGWLVMLVKWRAKTALSSYVDAWLGWIVVVSVY